MRRPLGLRLVTTDLSRATAVPQLTKICATIGPASEQLPMLKQVVAAGMRIMRLNFSHATYEEADLRMKNLKLSPGKNFTSENLNLRAVMLDTQGPEIRTGSFAGGVKEITWEIGQKVQQLNGSRRRLIILAFSCMICWATSFNFSVLQIVLLSPLIMINFALDIADNLILTSNWLPRL
jgi:Pyruvate kinase, barrel domain